MLSVLVLLDPVIDIDGQTNADDARPTDHDRSEKRRRAAPARGYQELRRKRPYEALSAPSMTFALSRLREPEEGYTGPSTYEAEEKEKELIIRRRRMRRKTMNARKARVPSMETIIPAISDLESFALDTNDQI